MPPGATGLPEWSAFAAAAFMCGTAAKPPRACAPFPWHRGRYVLHFAVAAFSSIAQYDRLFFRLRRRCAVCSPAAIFGSIVPVCRRRSAPEIRGASAPSGRLFVDTGIVKDDKRRVAAQLRDILDVFAHQPPLAASTKRRLHGLLVSSADKVADQTTLNTPAAARISSATSASAENASDWRLQHHGGSLPPAPDRVLRVSSPPESSTA